MNLGTATVLRADARHLPIPDNTVDLVVTSPPYFALRSYRDGGVHYAGQIGSEPTPAEFVAALLEVTRECVRVLKPSGSLFVNLGDKYARSGGGGGGSSDGGTGRNGTKKKTPQELDAGYKPSIPAELEHRSTRPATVATGAPEKSLIGIPWRYALACIDELGLILRAELIWSKPNGLPESVTDRVRRSHEQWFHFTLEPRYFSAVDEIREGYAPGTAARYAYGFQPAIAVAAGQSNNGPTRADGGGPGATNPLGKLPGSVWTIPTEPLKVPDHLGIDHFAAFPTEWPRRIIQGWSPAGVCVECGEGRRPVGQSVRTFDGEAVGPGEGGIFGDMKRGTRNKGVGNWRFGSETTITGYTCACPEPTADTRPAVILDPFGGTGTTALVAKALGRHGISVDMSADYCRLAAWRTNDRDQLAKVLGIAKAGPQAGDDDLFGLLEGGYA